MGKVIRVIRWVKRRMMEGWWESDEGDGEGEEEGDFLYIDTLLLL